MASTSACLLLLTWLAGGKVYVDAQVGEEQLDLIQHDVAQALLHAADLAAQDLEAAGHRAGRHAHGRVTHGWRQVGVLGQRRHHRHQVRLAGAVVADDQHPLVVHRPVDLQLLEHQVDQLIGHAVRDDVGLHELGRLLPGVSLAQLDDALDRVELDQVAVFHGDPSTNEARGLQGNDAFPA
ncbi:MAG: hypothetical protein V9H69_02355 [Anaerolineae bacterium]